MTEKLDRQLVAELNRSSTDPERKTKIIPILAQRVNDGVQLSEKDAVTAVTRLACVALDQQIRDSAFHAVQAILETRHDMADVVAEVAGDYARKDIFYQKDAANRVLALVPEARRPEGPAARVRRWLSSGPSTP